MKTHPIHFALITLSILGLSACTDGDRELAQKKGDGLDTFKFKVPPELNGSASASTSSPASSSASSSASRRASIPSGNKDIDTFQFKLDPKYFPEAKKAK